MIINSGFIGNYKIGDNINYNLKVLRELYGFHNQVLEDGRQCHLYKPIVVTIASICEAVLYDFLNVRARTFTREGISSVTDEFLINLRSLKSLDKFAILINKASSYNLFDKEGTDYYCKLHKLRELRNRVHIQNTGNSEPVDEDQAFDVNSVKMAEKLLESMLKHMTKFHLRPKEMWHCDDFELPWSAHFP